MTTTICALCNEPAILDARPINRGADRAHRVCLLRSALGGIGHLEDHDLWCVKRGDPDGGRSYYRSALEVDDWYAALGQQLDKEEQE